MDVYLFEQLLELLQRAKYPVLIADERIDDDSLGASLAVADYLAHIGKPTRVYVSNSLPARYQTFPHADWCTDDASIFKNEEIDLVVSFDCSDREYIRELVSKVHGTPFLVNVDHHNSNPRYGDLNVLFTTAPATCEVVYRFFKHNHIEISREVATCLLSGICFDTGIFSNSATDEQAFCAASELMLCGARIQDVIRSLFQNRSVAVLRLWGIAFERIIKHSSNGILSTFLTRKDIEENSVTDDDVDGLSNFLSLVSEDHSVFVLRETADGGIKMSMRSQHLDVSSIAKALGGGGHKKAAGFTISNARIKENTRGGWRIEPHSVIMKV